MVPTYYILIYGGISSSDFARNLDGKRPVRSRRLNHLLLCPTDFTDLHRFRPVRSMDDVDLYSLNFAELSDGISV